MEKRSWALNSRGPLKVADVVQAMEAEQAHYVATQSALDPEIEAQMEAAIAAAEHVAASLSTLGTTEVNVTLRGHTVPYSVEDAPHRVPKFRLEVFVDDAHPAAPEG